MKIAALIATVCGVGHLRPAPGTWGSLAALPLGWLIHVIGGPWLLLIAIISGFIKGVWATTQVTRGSDDHDPSEIVIDEVVGQWIALLPLSFGAWHAGASITALWPGWIAAFALFRLFDIAKPGPVGWADRRGDPLGVMLDDVIAGIFAAVGVILFAAISHGVLGL
ncbi:phosphatidylglycerophosphatase A [Pseudohalocynthiibacter aestuariivivens]|uniref:Phosphatidylglycerophosphatase A n=1 Tax=Roseovarius pelagicus TaxID=2980108 RepID=A0ABY6DC56_9RHOB|nr:MULTISPECIES: phosphatidylglycerophosphatase A [Rhodobacterales]QIE44417.1 phosphatidylglycerophosphatase A [Pseudohalocynthiibacter aestuariivivens]UXX83665.1 phosphatidylglycerophosphatase A [Roseovarius pelagicus]